jgi:hypothetical protein
MFPSLVFDPKPLGNRGTWEQIVEAGPVVLGEFIFPLGQSGFISNAGVPDPHFTSLHSIWGEWRFVPMLHIAEDLAADPDGDVDGDTVLDGFEEWYFGSNAPLSTDDFDTDGADLAAEFANGLDPTEADTDGDGMPDGFELANGCLNQPQLRDATDDADTDGLDNLGEYTAGADPCDDDTDDDTILDGADDDPVDEYVCQDLDADTCDDCAVTGGPPNTANDGPDNEPDGLCDAGDPDDDDDTVLDGADTDPLDPNVCQDLDTDTCDDCAVTGGPPDTANDGPDNEPDGLCDAGDPDDDNDNICDPGEANGCTGSDNCPLIANGDQTNSDTDSHGDACDNCLTTDNEDQANTDEDLEDAGASIVGDPLGNACDDDDDNDGFDDAIETYLPTMSLDNCTCGPGPGGDAWPLDINMDCYITVVGDVLAYAGNTGVPVGGSPTLQRLDLNMDNFITIVGDVYEFAGNIAASCT